MSFILDALKKSESERQQQGQSTFAHVPVGDGSRRPPTWLWALGALLLINLAVLTGLLLRPAGPATGAGETAPALAGSMPDTASPAAAEPHFEDRVRSAIESQPAAPQTQPSVPEDTYEITARQVPVPTVPEPRVETRPPVAGEVPDIDQLRASGELPIGDLRLDIHVYSDNPDDRFVFINMVKHREGSSTSDGLVVRTITRDGVILSYRGRDFILPRQ